MCKLESSLHIFRKYRETIGSTPLQTSIIAILMANMVIAFVSLLVWNHHYALSLDLYIDILSCPQSNIASECNYDFRVYSCGVYGGAFSSSLTSFFISTHSDPFNFLSMDAGTSLDCIQLGHDNGQLSRILDHSHFERESIYNEVGYFRKSQLNGFLLTHSHLDHLEGLLLSSAEDSFSPKPIISRPEVIDVVLNKIFTDPLWVNYAEFGYYNISIPTENTGFSSLNGFDFKIRTFPLSHTVPSTAFLICDHDEISCILFLGDTGPDKVEQSHHLHDLWKTVAPFVADGRVNTIFMECSYVNGREDSQLFGHLTPQWMLKELYVLAQYAAQCRGSKSIDGVLSDLYVMVMHIKPTFLKDQDTEETRHIIESELNHPMNATLRKMGVHFIIPKQTDLIYIKKDLSPSVDSRFVSADALSSSSFHSIHCIHGSVIISVLLFYLS